jgi:outer membrane murein-binding lipoprotein Lpp
MSEGKVLKLDVIMIVILIGVVLAGFWMTGTAMDAQMGVLEQKIDVVQTQTKGTMQAVADLHDAIRAMKAPAVAPAPAPAPAAAPAKAAPAPAPAKQ